MKIIKSKKVAQYIDEGIKRPLHRDEKFRATVYLDVFAKDKVDAQSKLNQMLESLYPDLDLFTIVDVKSWTEIKNIG
jgi:hypothetical protein